MAYDIKRSYDVKGLDFPKEKQLEVLRELLAALEDGRVELTGALCSDRKITVWAEVLWKEVP